MRPARHILIKSCIIAFVFIAAFLLIQAVFVPKYTGTVIEGRFVADYYDNDEDGSHDLLVIGNCETYANISTVELWRDYGITSYIRGCPNQLMSQTYYILKDTLKYETPKVVLINLSSMAEDGQSTEEYNRMAYDGLKAGSDKLEAIEAEKLDGESMLSYIFPLLRFHSRWSDLGADDFRYAFSRPETAAYNGYYLRADIRPYSEYPAERRRADYTFPEKNYEYLDKIRELCGEKGISLMLMKAPRAYPEWPDPYDEQCVAYAEEHGLYYVNYMNLMDEIGLDMSHDTYDEGLHLNVYGAEKLTRHLGGVLREEYGLTGHKGEADTDAYYTAMGERYDAEIAAQEADFAEHGYITKYNNEDGGM